MHEHSRPCQADIQQIITRAEAKALGLSGYFTGKPCKHGHVAERRVVNHQCRECAKIITREFKKNNPSYIDEWNSKNIGYYTLYRQSWRKKNPERSREYIRNYKREWYKTRIGKMTVFMSVNVRNLLLGKKTTGSAKLLGYSPERLSQHIERQFVNGMSWENYGKWHIDHIIPISHFLKNGVNDPKIINALSNLRPMWAKQNQEKSDLVEFLL